MSGFEDCTCEHCEELMQPYLDRELTPDEQAEAEAHLDGCTYCRRRFTFEAQLRVYVKNACCEEMSPELKAKLVALKLPDA
jgi:anti-sigma factor (TIGR02949 family)